MLPIKKKFIKYNYSSRSHKRIEYIVIHDTGNTSKGAGADNHYRYFNGGNRNASAHYFVDDKEIIQTVKDTNASWHCGDGRGKYSITNSNSIGVEICINSDGDYEKAVANTVGLVNHLMNKHNIPIDRVVRHYDASRKICPRTMSHNNWERWKAFKQCLQEKQQATGQTFYRVMAGSFSQRENAERQVERLKAAGFDATIMIFKK